MNKHYLLPILAMIEIMKWSPDTVVLQAHLVALPGVSNEACLAQVMLGQGNLSSCTITTTMGAVLLQQQEAYQALERCGELHWSVFPASSLSTSISQTNPPFRVEPSDQHSSMIPSRRVSTITSETLATLSHRSKRVLALVDGKRSIDVIAQLLSISPYEVQQKLKALSHLIDC